LLISQSFFNNLDPDVQTAIKEAAIEARDFERQALDDMNKSILEELEASGMIVNEVDKEPFIKAVQPVYEKFSDQIGADFIKQVQDAQN